MTSLRSALAAAFFATATMGAAALAPTAASASPALSTLDIGGYVTHRVGHGWGHGWGYGYGYRAPVVIVRRPVVRTHCTRQARYNAYGHFVGVRTVCHRVAY
jgi:hypothetical protein